MPVEGGAEKIYASTSGGQTFGFAWYSCPPNNRLNIHIKELGEVVYLGFQKVEANNRQFRIKDPSNAIVMAATNIPTNNTQPGYIETYDQAVAGPNQVVTTGGYDAILFTPATTGDFYIEFSGNTTFQYFDITVASASNQKINGRLWSKAWQFSMGNTPPDSYNGTFYIYTDDQLVSSMNLNGLQGITFTVACNQQGCPAPSGGGYTRNSVNGKQVIPQYKIFLNDPDITEYPTGTLGSISNVIATWNCDGTATITFDVTQLGSADILLNLDPAPGKQPIDVLLTSSAVPGTNTVTWNGINGLGAVVPNGTLFEILVTYIMGLTNFPMYDVEANTNGLIVNLVRPVSPNQMKMYWDDTYLTIPSGTECSNNVPCPSTTPPPSPISNYTGCTSATGCHTWSSVCGNPGQCSYGNENTVNTYWYAVYTDVPPITFIEHRVPGPPASPSGLTQICSGAQFATYTIPAEPNSTTYTWEITGPGVSFNPPNPSGTTATIEFSSNASVAQISVKGWNSNCGFGTVSTPTTITIFPTPELVTAPSKSTCSGVPFSFPLSSTVTPTTFSWNVNFSDCSGNIAACPMGSGGGAALTGNLSVTDLNPGTVNYHVTPTAGICTGLTKTITVAVAPKPNVTSPSPNPEFLCSGGTTTIVLQSGMTGPSLTWSWTTACSNIQACPSSGTNTTLSVTPQLTSNASPGSVQYTIIPAYGGCSGDPLVHTVNVWQLPDVVLLPFPQVCLNTAPFAITGGTPVGGGGVYTYQGNPITTFNPAAMGEGTFTITYTYTDGNGCTASDQKAIVVQGLITPNLTPLVTVCVGVPQSYSTDAGMVPASYVWTVLPDGTATGALPNVKSITWSTTGTKSVSVIYTDPQGCQTRPAVVTVTVNPLPVINITGNLNTCIGKTYSYATEPSMTGYNWSVSPGNTMTTSGNSASVTWNVQSAAEWIEVNYIDANGCTRATPFRKTVNVNASPVHNITGSQLVCAASAGIGYSTDAGLSTYSWAVSAGGSISGPGNGNSVNINWQATAAGSQAVSVTYSNSLGCSNTTTLPVTIKPLPTVTFSNPSPSFVCQDFPTKYLYYVDPGGPAATYLWQVTPPSLAVIDNPTANPASITWSLPGSTPQTALLTLQATTTGTAPQCTATSSPVAILIKPKTVTQLQACFDPVTTQNAKPFTLKGGSPSGATGTFHIDNITAPAIATFVPSAYSVGNHTIYYSYTNVDGCIAISSRTIRVDASNSGFSCGSVLTDPRDSKTYKTVNIPGSGCWMQENLVYGGKITFPVPQADNCLWERYCLTGDPTCSVNGGLYQWDELMQYTATDRSQGFCPPGWHIPNESEWASLIDALATVSPGDGIAGSFLKDMNTNGLFKASPAGVFYLNNTESFTGPTFRASLFWTSTAAGSDRALARGINVTNPSVSRYEGSRADAFPVRCVKD